MQHLMFGQMIQLSKKLFMSESGDHDMVAPYMGPLKWITNLNLTLVDNWRPWHVNSQVAGYTMKYRKNEFNLTFATVKARKVDYAHSHKDL
ncbi:serine carboxypeptidase-like 18 [Olea europaea subsp. europaea]|uniref:Serine carboxypeptidase-like 18 n=1 Tax=Olea europaea subsp. europaea TaxID=158383 RepID=A0A8S0U9N7_OLEEU|nr:serine carboxypeptidase-like 18 [Olea europaea subsp. europaea]